MEENLDRVLARKTWPYLQASSGLQFHIKKYIITRRWHINSVPSDDVRDSRVVEYVYVSSTITSIIENPLANSYTQIADEIHEFYESTSDDIDVRVDSSTLIPIDVHTHDNDTSVAECEPVVEST